MEDNNQLIIVVPYYYIIHPTEQDLTDDRMLASDSPNKLIKLRCGEYTRNIDLLNLETEHHSLDHYERTCAFRCGSCSENLVQPFRYGSIVEYHGFNNWLATKDAQGA
jgi:hypothetical protein